ncbi:hypothetical protein QQM39_13930 [Streptomyces sp. DT2A-34]|uniref:hypothetical protein n=1 Tax=Streptomyces sp. DT2A-34 TaxID=3051182 RepID=UPI00265BA123|nr:hypothetical protein [Streptomyces sp. DT2A-34]MDO0911906.1 hypothetical protein [Streptomyces sp. DT2A-34]
MHVEPDPRPGGAGRAVREHRVRLGHRPFVLGETPGEGEREAAAVAVGARQLTVAGREQRLGLAD